MAEREFKLTFLGDSRKAQAAIGDLDRKLGGLGGKVSGLTGLTVGPQGLAVAFGGALVGGIAASIKSTAAFADEIEEMSQRTGLSTTRLQELQHAANLTGTDLSGLEVGVRKMQSVLTDAANGSKAAEKAFEALGLEASDLVGLGTDKQLEKIMVALANIEDPTKRAAAAVDIFGRSGTDLLPMLAGGEQGLKDNAEAAHKYSGVMNEEAIKSAAEFQDKLDTLQGKLGGLQRALSGPMIDFLLDFAEKVEAVAGAFQSAASMVQGFSDAINRIPGAQAIRDKLDIGGAVKGGLLSAIPGVSQVKAVSDAIDLIGMAPQVFRGGPAGLTDSEADPLWASEGFAKGGVIPGPRGMPVILKAHAGERISPAGGYGGVNIQIYGNLLTSQAELQRMILEALHMANGRGSLGLT